MVEDRSSERFGSMGAEVDHPEADAFGFGLGEGQVALVKGEGKARHFRWGRKSSHLNFFSRGCFFNFQVGVSSCATRSSGTGVDP